SYAAVQSSFASSVHRSPPVGLSVPCERYTAYVVAPAFCAALPGRSHRFASPRPSAWTAALNGSSETCTVPVPVSPATRSFVRSKLSGHADATHACCAACGFGGGGGGGFVVRGADAAGVPCSEERYTPVVRFPLPNPGS